ncbi:PLD nuclease N-terminal domain-containing protein [Paenirhodobacter ferrireducens]
MGSNMMHLNGVWGLVILALDLWALVSIVTSGRSTGSKVLWALLVILLPVLGFLVWLVAGPRAASRNA